MKKKELSKIINAYGLSADKRLYFAGYKFDREEKSILSMEFRQPDCPRDFLGDVPLKVKRINSQDMDAKKLLQQIEIIAGTIYEYGTVKLPEAIVQFVQETKAGISFDLVITNDCAYLYRLDDKIRISQLLFLLKEFENKNITFFLYEYDTQFIRPKFVNDLKKWASQTFGL